MKKLIKRALFFNALLLLAFCSSCRFGKSMQEEQNANESGVSQQDSLGYQKGIEHSVNEKLLKKYKNDKKKK